MCKTTTIFPITQMSVKKFDFKRVSFELSSKLRTSKLSGFENQANKKNGIIDFRSVPFH